MPKRWQKRGGPGGRDMIQQSRKPLHPTALRNIAMAFSAAEIGLQICHRIPFEGGNCRIMMQPLDRRSEEHTSELQSLMRISYAVFCLKKKKKKKRNNYTIHT